MAISSAIVFGQSGRKSKKAESQPAIQGVNQPDTRVVPEPEAQAAKPKEKPLTILIASDLADIMGATFYADIARQACVAELRENRALDIQEQKDANRAEASKRAKQDEIFVVHLELRTIPWDRRVVAAALTCSSRSSSQRQERLLDPDQAIRRRGAQGCPFPRVGMVTSNAMLR